MGIHVTGLIGLLVFYIIIFGIGLAAFWKKGRRKLHVNERRDETIAVARRDIGWIIGGFSVTATWCGGGFINGMAEILFTKGLVNIQPPLGNALGLILGGLFFAKPMRENRYVTMLDPFQQKYGKHVSALIYLPACVSEVFWIAGMMAALGASVSVVMELDFSIAVSISVAFCLSYVLFGGIYSVTWTDMAEVVFVISGMVLCVPFIWCNDNVHLFKTRTNESNDSWSVTATDTNWIGTVELIEIPAYIDTFLLCTFGAIAWQDYFQRVLSAKSVKRAQVLSCLGGIGCILIGLPSAMVGVAARYANWNLVGYSNEEANKNSPMILPLALEYLTPKAVAFFGVGAVSAAVMASADAALLSIGTMFAINVYKPVIRKNASETEVVWILRLAIVIGGVLAASLAIFVASVMALWVFSCDIVYVILFPQLVCVLFIKMTNGYGAVAGVLTGFIVRILSGEPSLQIPTVTKYPLYNYETDTQLFPVKTLAMLLNFLVSLTVSYLVNIVQKRKQQRRTGNQSAEETDMKQQNGNHEKF